MVGRKTNVTQLCLMRSSKLVDIKREIPGSKLEYIYRGSF